jgi:hypothetical protein
MVRNVSKQLVAIMFALWFSSLVFADPLDGRDVLKFSQRPMINTLVPDLSAPEGARRFNGHDEVSTAYSVVDTTGNVIRYDGRFMADDFADRFDSPVVHVRWWGSYLNQPTFPPDNFVRRFLISFEEDVAAPVGGGFSHPGEPLLNQIVTRAAALSPGSGTFTEREVWPTSVDGPIFEYNAELHLDKAFAQKPDTVYWLKIVALVDSPPNLPPDQRLIWGWHNRNYLVRDPLASVPPPPLPGVTPGEHPQGFLPTASGATVPIWHFQDDAVEGLVRVFTPPTDPMSQIMPRIEQTIIGPTHYDPLADGPTIIGQFSKDLAFQLFTVPEPGSLILIVLAITGLAVHRRR